MAKAENNAPLTVEELQAKVAELQDAVTAGQKQKDDLTAIAQDQEKQLEALKAENETLKAVNIELTNELEAISKKDLKAVVQASQEKTAPVLSKETFTVDGKSYGFNYPVITIKGKRITNDDVLASKELQAELVAANHSMIKAV